MQKEREHYYLEKAQAAYPDLPQGTAMSTESPDFLFQSESKLLGIEITDFVRRVKRDSPLSLRTVENLHAMVALQAKAIFEAKYDIPLWIALHWDDRFRFSKKDVPRVASQLIDVIEKDIPREIYEGTSFNWDSHGDFPIFEALHRISVRRLKDRTKGVWAEVESGFIGGTIADIQEIVDAKEPKVQSYLTKCDEVWLLIIADGTHISSTLDFDVEPSATLHTQFARVLLYNGESKSVFRLK
jgi:hypothetical protein